MTDSNNVIMEKSKQFAIRIIRFAKYLSGEQQEHTLAKQILRCGTSIGANIYESRNAQSREDFAHKLSIALKEADETHYWLEILYGAEIISQQMFQSLWTDLDEIISLLTAIIKTTKQQ